MTIEIVGNMNRDSLYCAGSLTKLLTTYVCLSHLKDSHFPLSSSVDDEDFLDKIACNQASLSYLKLFQSLIGSKFTIRDLCTFYSGLPYTFDLTARELELVEQGYAFKHHNIHNEDEFLQMCRNQITPVYKNRCKFHYSEIAIIFLGYFFEKCFLLKIEELYDQYVFKKFNLQNSLFARSLPEHVLIKDLSPAYDYPSIAILDHGFFCYSNGFYTTLNDMKKLLEQLLDDPVFNYMIDVNNCRAASNRLLNGMTVEIRMIDGNVICGYEGFSFSGCNIWNYSLKDKKGYLTFTDDEEVAYQIIYDGVGYSQFDKTPEFTQKYYINFLLYYPKHIDNNKVPALYRGLYKRVKINDSDLELHFELGEDYMIIRNPEMFRYDLCCLNGTYRVIGKDKIPGAKVGLYNTNTGNYYFLFDGTLYKKD